MTYTAYTEAIREGFRLINSRWQLIAVQAGLMLFNTLAFFILVGIPLGIAFIIFGLDLTGLAELKDLFGLLKNPAELISKYFGLVLVIVLCFLLYLLLVTLIGLYVFSGSIGFIGRSLREPSTRFSVRGFLAEARAMFMPITWYSLVIALLFLVIAFVLGLVGGGVAVLVSAAKGQDSTLGLFLGIFFSLVLVLAGVSLILLAIAVTVYGFAVLVFERQGAVKTVRSAAHFLWSHQSAFWLYVLLFLAYIVTSFVVMLIVYPFNLIPLIGPIISFPFHILSYIVQGYLGLVILAAVFSFYYHQTSAPGQADGKHQERVTTENSIPPADTSIPEAPAQEPPPPQAGGPGPDAP